jgi:excinuclease ABC subunit A
MTARSPRLISLRGVRTHNLKGVDLDLPPGRLIVVTGVSGAGKGSLAFDTLYAEGQRRYVETFSPYSRQFLEKLDKPDAESIAGIPPAIGIAPAKGRHSRRSTIGSITEINDSLALLFARTGQVMCRRCGHLVSPATPATVAQSIDALPAGARYEIAFPVDVRPETDVPALYSALRADGFTRARINDQLNSLADAPTTAPADGQFDVIVDRLVRGKETAERRSDSIETAFRKGLGRCRVLAAQDSQTHVRGWTCSRCGTEHRAPEPNLFRDSSAIGACSHCEGFGQTMELDLGRIVPDPAKTIRAGAILPWKTPAYRGFLDELLELAPSLDIPVDVPFRRLEAATLERLVEGDRSGGFTGLRGFFQGLERKAYRLGIRVFLNRWRRYRACPACQGARLRPEALAVKVAGRDFAAVSALPILDARSWVRGLTTLRREPAAAPILARIESRLSYLAEIGLDYLTLDRPARTLSSGELQRVILTRALGSGLVNTLYVLDEPSAGLHAREVGRLVAILQKLRDQGNTVVVVEHDQEVIRGSDHVVDLGPAAGEAGGRVLYAGPLAGFPDAQGSATSDFLNGRKQLAVPSKRRAGSGRSIVLKGARGNNLKAIDVSFPLGALCLVTGVSGSGKSTLVEETLFPALRYHIAREAAPAAPFSELSVPENVGDVVLLDQSPLARSPRSNAVTYLKAFDEIRKTFAATHDAKLRNYDAGRFSFNVEGGRCNACQGNGFLTVDMQFLPDVMIRCSECRGTRYRPEVLEITYRGRNIAEVLDLTAREAFAFFRHRPRIQARLRPLLEIGLDYLRLGQPVSTLSGGEAQRLKLAGFLARSLAALRRAAVSSPTVFLLDEPTVGLHSLDSLKLLDALNALVDRGHSVIAIEHRPEVMLCADWIIDLGPGAGADGGTVVAQGTPEEIARSATPTGQVLARLLPSAPSAT